MSDPQESPTSDDASEANAVTITPDGKVEVTDPALLDVISGGAGGHEGDVSEDAIAVKNGGCGVGC